tara:strand:+ start:348 stop:539 length:192 start_codon:yes stop_codon:yes gene_type:complete
MIVNKNNSKEFELTAALNKPINFKFKKVMSRKTQGTLNDYEKVKLSAEDLDRIEQDKRRLGGS